MLELFQYYLFFMVTYAFYGSMKDKTARELTLNGGHVQYLYIVMFALWILIGMRDVLYGRDTLGYVVSFKNATSLDLEDSVEPGFTLLTFIVRTFTSNYHVYLMVASLSVIVAMYQLLRRYLSSSYEIVASICIYVLLGLLAFNMAALRQSIAMSLGIFAFMYAGDGKWKHFLVSVGIAYLFHHSALALLILYPLRAIDARQYGLYVALVFFVYGIINPGSIAPLMQAYIPFEDRFTQYGSSYESSQNYTGFALQMILVLIAYLRRDKLNLKQSTLNLFFNTAYLGLAIQSLTGSIAELYRLSFYFCVFDIILVPIALTSIRGSSSPAIRKIFIIGCLIYIFVLSGGGVLPRKQEYMINDVILIQ